MWRSVLKQAITDASSNDDKLRLEIAQWLTDDTGDFDTVCHYAAVDEDFMSESIEIILKSPPVVRYVLSKQIKDAIDTIDYTEDNNI